MHQTVSVDQLHPKKLSETVKSYNASKVGVHVLDQMVRYHICKSATRRWPVAVVFNIIDCACISAYIIYSEVTGHSLTRREFLLQLIKEMCSDPSMKSALHPLPTMVMESSSQSLRERKQCQLQLCRNKSSVNCHKCLKSCCGRHILSTFIVVTCSSCAKESS